MSSFSKKILLIIALFCGLKVAFNHQNLIYGLILLVVILIFLVDRYLQITKLQKELKILKEQEKNAQIQKEIDKNLKAQTEIILNKKFQDLILVLQNYAKDDYKVFAKNLQRNLNIYLNYKAMALVLAYIGPELFKDIFFLLNEHSRAKISEVLNDVKDIDRSTSYEIIYNFLDNFIKDGDKNWHLRGFRANSVDVAAELEKPECTMKFNEPFRLDEMSEILSKENSQIISAVLINLTYNLSKALLDTFDEIKKKEIIKNMANINEISDEIVSVLNQTLVDRLKDYDRKRFYLQ